ncbi:MAG: FAD-binding oxidoreductase [Fimbriimonadales bacterium]|nr:FAD-binding oxidoreductase [Fimbriimonadales bacterium]
MLERLRALREAVLQAGPLRVSGSGSKTALLPTPKGADLPVGLQGILELAPDDQYLEAWAGTPIAEIQEEASRKGLCLPMPSSERWGQALAGFPGTLGGLVAANLPHGLWAQCGGPRDWILRVELVTADGRLVKAGCKAVKNVAGYDVPKLMVGSRGSLGILVRIGVRLWPLRAVPTPAAQPMGNLRPNWIQRTLASDFDRAIEAASESIVAVDRASSTLWARLEPGRLLPRQPADWVVCPWVAEPPEGPERELVRRLKTAVDPSQKLNPGVFGWI